MCSSSEFDGQANAIVSAILGADPKTALSNLGTAGLAAAIHRDEDGARAFVAHLDRVLSNHNPLLLAMSLNDKLIAAVLDVGGDIVAIQPRPHPMPGTTHLDATAYLVIGADGLQYHEPITREALDEARWCHELAEKRRAAEMEAMLPVIVEATDELATRRTNWSSCDEFMLKWLRRKIRNVQSGKPGDDGRTEAIADLLADLAALAEGCNTSLDRVLATARRNLALK
jgi:hypothetical protein